MGSRVSFTYFESLSLQGAFETECIRQDKGSGFRPAEKMKTLHRMEMKDEAQGF